MKPDFSLRTRARALGLAMLGFGMAAASAQDLNAMNNAFNAQLNAQMGATQNSIIRRNLADPHVMALYRQHLAQGGRMTPEQFAYAYAATGGFTPQGYANYNNTSRQIGEQLQGSMQGLRNAEAARAQAQGQWSAGYINNQQEAGRGLMGQGSYVDPRSGSPVQLDYLPSAQPSYNPQTGMYYMQDANGNYYASRGDGNWVPMAPAYGR